MHFTPSLASTMYFSAFCVRLLQQRNLLNICSGTCVVPWKYCNKVPLNDSKEKVDVAHKGPQFLTLAARCVRRWTLNVIFAAPYNFSNCSENFLRALSATSISQRFTFSPKRMCIANTNRKRWFQNFFSKTPFSKGRA